MVVPSAPEVIRNYKGSGVVVTHLQGHDGNASRARDCGASRFARSRVERRDLVRADLESHIQP